METTSKLYINELKQALNHNHAAVLIGSGFSLNADDVNPVEAHRMPTWYNLADSFCEKLGIDIKNPDYLETNHYLDPLTLAEKVEAMYGRPFLDELLIEQMKDELHKPSELHKKLLSLPWNDVFTTNYDTLLERTLDEITNKYRVVLDQNDLMYSKSDGRSRIVKLHGSFPSTRPFIITKEDFRKYPYDHAPFVNTVQQSLLENTFCLIGFSGDDPNFLSWIGWIRDNLGNNSPKIYMVVKDPCDKIQEKMFLMRNVEHIVLRDVYRAEKRCPDLLNAFLDDLLKQNDEYRNRRNTINWPDINYLPRFERGKEEEFLNRIKEIRKSYPGYITVPYSRLDAFEHLLNCFREFFWRKKEEVISHELDITYEYCWLLNAACRPLLGIEIENTEAIVEMHKGEKNNQSALKDIYFTLLYAYRMHGDNSSWQREYDLLKNVCKNEYDILRLQYEEIMYHLYNLQILDVEKLTDAFAPSMDYPEFMLNRSWIVALLGRYEEAERSLKENLAYVRRFVSRDERENNLYHSIESCIVSLYNHVNQARRASAGEFWIDPTKDKELLNTIFDDVYSWDKENRYYSSAMTDYYRRREYDSTKYAFDVGVRTETHLFSDDKEAIRAYQFIGFREKTGHPFRIGNITNKVGVKGTAIRLDIYNLKLPILLYFLSGEKKIIEEALTRPVLSAFSVESVDDLLSQCIVSIKATLENNKGTSGGWFLKNIWEYSLHTIPEVISRLISKCSDEMFGEVAEILLQIYSSTLTIERQSVRNLADRFMKNAPLELLLEKQDELFKLPMLKSDDINHDYPDLINMLYIRFASVNNRHLLKLDLTEEIKKQLEDLVSRYERQKCPKPVISRLIHFYLLYNVGSDLKEKIKKTLWCDFNLDEDGLPNVADFSNAILYDLPHDISMSALHEKLWTKAISELQRISESNSLSDYTWAVRTIEQIIQKRGISIEEAEDLFPIILKICNKCVSHNIGISFGNVSVERNLKEFGELSGIILLESGLCSSRKHYSNEYIEEIMLCLSNSGVAHVLLRCCTVKQEERVKILEDALFSGSHSEYYNATDAMYYLNEKNIKASKSILNKIIAAFITANSIDGADNARIVEYLIREKILSKSDCKAVAAWIEKYDRFTRIGSTDFEDEVWGKKLESRKMISILAHTLKLYFENQNISAPEGIVYWENIVSNNEEFVEIRRTWE